MRTAEACIIGAGPAGIAAAVQLARYGIEAILYERDAAGGLLREANLVENYPGFPGGIPGSTLAALFAGQLAAAGVEIRHENVTKLEYTEGTFRIATERGEAQASSAVVASGTRPRRLEAPAVPDAAAGYVWYSVLPLLRARGMHVAVIGAGDSAFDHALRLAPANTLTILNRSRRAACLPLLRKRAEATGRIVCRDGIRVEAIECDGEGLLLCCRDGEGACGIAADCLLVAIGREPCLDFLGSNLRLHRKDLVREGKLQIIGDAGNGIFRQAAIAAGDGVRAAMEIALKLGGSEA
ncbi:MAG: NAD(P)/FAD-dependent oxidoreductase [Methanomicrobiaceae archaeon]|nr:NAD(P)/FAD-dependent oxidoreductase [Methanomicrobiaceae archaeon]